MKQYQIVQDPRIARNLIKNGFLIIDIKENKFIRNATVFVFENTEAFKIIYGKIKEMYIKEII